MKKIKETIKNIKVQSIICQFSSLSPWTSILNLIAILSQIVSFFDGLGHFFGAIRFRNSCSGLRDFFTISIKLK